MRIVLTQCPAAMRGTINYIPIGLLSLASYIKQQHHQPIIVDFNVLSKNKRPSHKFFMHLAKKLLSHKPQVLGFSVMLDNFPAALLVAKECKKLAPHIPIIFGGPEVSFEEMDVLRSFVQIDIIVRGEGEITLVEILKALKNKDPLSNILGVSYREVNNIIRNPDRPLIKDLNKLPLLDYSLLPHLDKYQIGQFEAGRGCPFQCTFCSTSKMWRRIFRIKSPTRLVRELENTHSTLKNNTNYSISILHDHLLASGKVANKFLSLIANKGITWSCFSRLEPLNANLIKKLKKAGCRGIVLGIESASPKIQKDIKKYLPLATLSNTIKELCQNQIPINLSFIIGFPSETKSQINQTLKMALNAKQHKIPPCVQINPLIFLKGSEIYNKLKVRFPKSKFWQMNISPLYNILPEEVSLIKKHPQIFPSFYNLKRNDLDPMFLEKIFILYNILTENFSLTTLSLLKHLPTTPLKLGRGIINLFDSEGFDWSISHNNKRIYDHYYTSLNKLANDNSSPHVRDVFLMKTN